MGLTVFSHPECSLHNMGSEHPESPNRIKQIHDQLIGSSLNTFVSYKDSSLADIDLLKLAHDEAYIDSLVEKDSHLQASIKRGEYKANIWLDGDTLMMPHSFQAARRAAGAAINAVDEVMNNHNNGNNTCAFGAVRPPGHHALRDAAMGFCILSNVAIAARYAVNQYHLQRVAIVDFDVHHGNGTEDILQGDSNIFLYSSYQKNFYPFPDATKAKSNITHTPLAAGSNGQVFREAITPWFEHLETLKPELIIISAGFDAHAEDPLAQLFFEEDDYYWITKKLVNVANKHSSGRIVSMLEGGYNLNALSSSVIAHLKALTDN